MQDGQWITLSNSFKLDVRCFAQYADRANGVFYYQPERPHIEIECDSSLYGGGGVALKFFYSWVYPKHHVQKYPHIHHLEAVNLLVAYRTLASMIHQVGVNIVISTDNSGSSFALQSGRTKDPVFASCSRQLWLEATTNNHLVLIRHKPGYLLPLSDALSRQSRDPHKAAFVSEKVAQQKLVPVSPVTTGHVFFDDML